MVELGWAWTYFASIQASIFAGVFIIILLWKPVLSRKEGLSTRPQRAAGMLALSASFYTFGVLIFSQLLINGPNISLLISNGFGDERIAWLLLAIFAEQAIRLIDLAKT